MILLDPLARPVIAHRGDRAHAPENTMRAFVQAMAAGADALELDVQLSGDGRVVVCHDETVDRTTNGSAAIGAMPYAAIRALDAGDGESIPLLSDIVDAFATTPLVIDLKTNVVAEPAIAVLEKHHARGRVLLGSFEEGPVAAARQRGFFTTASPGALRRLLPRALVRLGPQPERFDAISIPPEHYGFPLPIGGYVRVSGVPVHVWTVNDPAKAANLWRSGVCGIITDDPATMVAVRGTLRAA